MTRDETAIKLAHDTLAAVIERISPPIPMDFPLEVAMRAARSVLCWVLCDQCDQTFELVLDEIGQQIADSMAERHAIHPVRPS